MQVCQQFDLISCLHAQSGKQAVPKHEKDLQKVIEQLHSHSKVFQNVDGRKHERFNITSGVLSKVSSLPLSQWVRSRMAKVLSQ